MGVATDLNPHFAYTVVYVKDVGKSAEFYSKAFGFNVHRLDHSRRWGELESGSTTIALTPVERHETEITRDVDAAFKHAVKAGATAVLDPESKEWGQKVGYVR